MWNLTTLPLEDWFETSLSQSWDWAVWTINVNATPNFTFPAGVTTYIVVNPTNSLIQIAEIDSYDPVLKTLNVTNITLEKWASVNSTAQTHPVNSKIIISDNYQFWKDIQTAINSKIDADDWLWVIYADPAARDAALPSPTNWMQVYVTSLWLFTDYIWWAWTNRATWSTPNADTTTSWKVEIATDAEVTAWTWTGWSWAVLSITPTQANKLINLATTDITSDETDYYGFSDVAAGGVNKKILKSNMRNDFAADETKKWMVERATDAEADAWTDTTRYITPAQAVLKTNTISISKNLSDATVSTVYGHSLGKTPKLITFNAIYATNQWSSWTYDWTTNRCIFPTWTPWVTSSTLFSIHPTATVWTTQQWAVSSRTSTNFTIDWTKVWAPTGIAEILVTLIA